jgi:DNA-binding MarR family transcriptional regulator
MKQRSWLQDAAAREKWLGFMQSFHPDIGPETIRLMHELGFVARSIYAMGEQSVEDAGLSLAQYRVLMHLFFAERMGDGGELNPSEISDRQGVSRNTMSTFIRNLEEDGLVVRRLDPDDRRRFKIGLTDRGRDVVAGNAYDHLEMIDRCFNVLSEDEQAHLVDMLHRLSAHVTEVASFRQE